MEEVLLETGLGSETGPLRREVSPVGPQPDVQVGAFVFTPWPRRQGERATHFVKVGDGG